MKLNRINTYYKVWKMFALNAWQETFINRGSNLLFMLGKIIRLGVSLLFLFLIRENIDNFAGYTTDQLVVFFLTYQFIDLLSQVFYRGVYIFSNLVRSGEFDFLLSKPINPLFRSLTGKPDINDAFFLLPNLVVSLYIFSILDVTFTLQSLFWYLILLINSMLIVTAIHVLVLVVGILTTEVDGVIWIYRDLNSMGRFPVTIYMEPLRFILFFLVPIGAMITIPTEILLGLEPTYSALIASAVGITIFTLSLQIWKWALRQYSSTGS
jgi:ABC-2 type transport system permease protein